MGGVGSQGPLPVRRGPNLDLVLTFKPNKLYRLELNLLGTVQMCRNLELAAGHTDSWTDLQPAAGVG